MAIFDQDHDKRLTCEECKSVLFKKESYYLVTKKKSLEETKIGTSYVCIQCGDCVKTVTED